MCITKQNFQKSYHKQSGTSIKECFLSSLLISIKECFQPLATFTLQHRTIHPIDSRSYPQVHSVCVWKGGGGRLHPPPPNIVEIIDDHRSQIDWFSLKKLKELAWTNWPPEDATVKNNQFWPRDSNRLAKSSRFWKFQNSSFKIGDSSGRQNWHPTHPYVPNMTFWVPVLLTGLVQFSIGKCGQ